MKLLMFLRFVPFSLLMLVVSCAQTPVTHSTLTPDTRSRFHEANAADLVLEYYRPDTIYMKRPAAHEGPFLTIFTRENISSEIARRVAAHGLAVVVIGQFHDLAQETALIHDWKSVLGDCEFNRVVFLRAGRTTKIVGLPVINDSIISGLHDDGKAIATMAAAPSAL